MNTYQDLISFLMFSSFKISVMKETILTLPLPVAIIKEEYRLVRMTDGAKE